MIATDGHMLVSVPLEREAADDLGAGYIPVDAIRAARKADANMPRLSTNENGQIGFDGHWTDRPMAEGDNGVGKYPDWRKVIPPVKVKRMEPDASINAFLLYRAQQALTASAAQAKQQGLELWFGVNDDDNTIAVNKPIVATLVGKRDGSFAVIMPMRSEKHPFLKHVDAVHVRKR